MNTVIMSGRMTNDPELRQTTTGKSVLSFRIAVNAGKDANGQAKADFFSCVAWNATANYLGQYAKKGTFINLTGRLTNRSYQAKDGTNRTATEIVVSSVEITPGQNSGQHQQESGQAAQPAAQAPATAPVQQPAGEEFADVSGEDLPF